MGPEPLAVAFPFRLARLALALALCGAIAGCAATRAEIVALERTTPWRAVPLDEVWTHQPTALVALGRDLGQQAEQLVGLPNETAVRGDNVLLMRAHRRNSPIVSVPELEEFLRRAKDLVEPFDGPIEGQLQRGEDRAGPYVWAEKVADHGARCVLAMRRVRRDAALLDPDFVALDITLRNCVDGDFAEAIAPVGYRYIAVANPGPGVATPRGISHLAGPLPLRRTRETLE